MRHPTTRGRRGATLPFVCIMLTAVLGAAALGVDLARLYYSATEVQAAADAAALAAARHQQYNASAGIAGVQTYAQWLAGLNRSGGQPVQVQSQDVLPVTYDPKTRAIGASTWSSSTAAFTVTAQAAVPSIFSGTPRTVRRSATAWIANLNGGNCVRPIAINYTRFYEEGVTHDTRYSSIGAFAPDFSLSLISSTQNSPIPGRTFIILPPGASKQWWLTNKNLYSHGNWQPVDFANGGYYGFGYALGGLEGSSYCTGNRAAVGDTKQPLIGDSATIIYAANQAMIVLCNRVGNAADAYCRNSNGTVGVKTRIMLTDSVNTNGTWTHMVREVAVARIMCYFQGATPASTSVSSDVCAYLPMSEFADNGTWCYFARGNCDGTTSGYPQGTMIALIDAPSSTNLTPDMVLGTKPGLTQRVLLAK